MSLMSLKSLKCKLIVLVVLICFVICTIPIFGQDASSNDKIYKWDMMLYVGLSQSPAEYFIAFADSVREKSNGRLDITVRPTGELPYKGTDALRVISTNEIQIADANSAYIAGNIRLAEIYAMPFLVTSVEASEKVGEIIEPYLTQELKKYNAEVLIKYNWPLQYFWGKGDTVSSFDDFKGLKVRTTGPEPQEFLKRIGATPVSMTIDEVPGAIQRGVMDALMTSGISIYDNKLHEVLDWGYLARYCIGSNYVLINSEAKSELPDDLQKILEDAASEYQDKIQETFPVIDVPLLGEMEKAGMEIIDPGEEATEIGAKIMLDYWEDWADKGGSEFEEILQKVREALGK